MDDLTFEFILIFDFAIFILFLFFFSIITDDIKYLNIVFDDKIDQFLKSNPELADVSMLKLLPR